LGYHVWARVGLLVGRGWLVIMRCSKAEPGWKVKMEKGISCMIKNGGRGAVKRSARREL